MAFDLSEMLAQVSNLDTGGKSQIEYIDLDNIDANDSNFYELSNLQSLANSIAMDGLQQPLVVMDGENGHVTLLSGHRRRAALRLLVSDAEEPREDLRMVPCIRRHYKSAAMAELQLILANSTARVLTSAETMRQAQRMEMLLYQLKEEGHEFPGRMRDQVAAACNVSASKLARLKVIREKLHQPFLGQFERDELSEQAAYALARLSDALQEKVAQVAGKKIIVGGCAENLLEKQEQLTQERTCTYRDPGDTCENELGRIKATACAQYSWQICNGGCCMSCFRADDCSGACAVKRRDKKDAKERRKAEEEKEKRRQQKTFEENRKLTQQNAQRYLRAAEAAGLGDDAVLKFTTWGPSTTVKDVRADASGEGLKDKCYYSPGYEPGREEIIKFAKQLNCSADYLLGLTDELRPSGAAPAEGWVPLQFVNGQEIPSRAGLYYCRFDCDGTMIRQVAWWDNDIMRWRFNKYGAWIDAECVGWFPLPED